MCMIHITLHKNNGSMIAKMQRHWLILSLVNLLKYIFFTSQYITATIEKSRLNSCKRKKRRQFCGKYCTS